MRRDRVLSLCVLGAVVACGSTSSSPGSGSNTTPIASVNGTIGGTAPQAVSAIASYRPITVGSVQGLSLSVSSNATTCTVWPGRSFTQFSFEIPGSPLSPGSYVVVSGDYVHHPIPSPGQATVNFSVTQDCKGMGSNDDATSGTVTISASDGSHVAGAFDVTFGDGHVSGTFDAPICTVDANAIKSDCP